MKFVKASDMTPADIETALDQAFAKFMRERPKSDFEDLSEGRQRKVTNVLLEIIRTRIEAGVIYEKIAQELNLSRATIEKYARSLKEASK